jgi:hypothetical protein
MARRLGGWRFLNVVLVDPVGASLSSAPHFDGSTVIALGTGDEAYLGIVQNSASYSTVSRMISSLANRMTVKYLGRD